WPPISSEVLSFHAGIRNDLGSAVSAAGRGWLRVPHALRADDDSGRHIAARARNRHAQRPGRNGGRSRAIPLSVAAMEGKPGPAALPGLVGVRRALDRLVRLPEHIVSRVPD